MTSHKTRRYGSSTLYVNHLIISLQATEITTSEEVYHMLFGSQVRRFLK